MELQRIRRILDGNPSEFSYFVRTYKHMAYSIAFRIVKDHEEASEIVQESFIRAYNGLSAFRGGAKFSTWFYRIVVNRAHSRRIELSRQEIEPDGFDAEKEDPEKMDLVYQTLTQDERIKYINLTLQQLPGEYSLLLTLFYLNENTLEEIQEIIGVPVPNLKMRLHRARKKMFILLQNALKHEIKSLL